MTFDADVECITMYFYHESVIPKAGSATIQQGVTGSGLMRREIPNGCELLASYSVNSIALAQYSRILITLVPFHQPFQLRAEF